MTKAPPARLQTLLTLALAFALPTGALRLAAQDLGEPAIAPSAEEINREGFTLHPAGAVEANNWAAEPPKIRFNFAITRADEQPFEGLTESAIEARIGTPPAEPLGARLESSSNAESDAVILIDVSGSMKGPKLEAAKSAVAGFLGNLREEDSVEIIVFDNTPRTVYEFGRDKSAAQDAFAGYEIVDSPGTALYDSILDAMERAQALEVRNVVVLTDGVDIVAYDRARSEEEKNQFKQEKEERILQTSRERGDIRVFTIAVGDREATDINEAGFVDVASLDRIAKGTNTLEYHYVDLPKLEAIRDTFGPAAYQQALVESLTAVLNTISEAFHYDYVLELDLDPASIEQGRRSSGEIIFWVGAVGLPVTFDYIWRRGEEFPRIDPPVASPYFIRPPEGLNGWDLTQIYLQFAGALMALALVPPVGGWLRSRRLAREALKAVTVIQRGSPLAGAQCPNERDKLGQSFLLQVGEAAIVCPKCGRAHHVGCWEQSGDKCWVRGCGTHLALPEEVKKTYLAS
ncbi:MAG: VWA domain-containing protein [Acidobacteria bacterium]|nr:VWA domain-containing protein [Acidobacteriota bacterium]